MSSDITLSDHRLLVLQLRPRSGTQRFVKIQTAPPKPIGWRLEDHLFNQLVRNSLHIPNPADHEVVPIHSYNIFTDGSAKMLRKRVVSAGWGFVAYNSLKLELKSRRV